MCGFEILPAGIMFVTVDLKKKVGTVSAPNWTVTVYAKPGWYTTRDANSSPSGLNATYSDHDP
jgi:hypothetical protein